jgi:hypothetical protein
LAVLGGASAVVSLVSVAVVAVRVWKAIPTVAERLAIVIGYGMMMLTTFGIITCGLMVVFNC